MIYFRAGCLPDVRHTRLAPFGGPASWILFDGWPNCQNSRVAGPAISKAKGDTPEDMPLDDLTVSSHKSKALYVKVRA